MKPLLRVDDARLWDRLMAMAKIGATPHGGCNRLALTDEDKRGRDLFILWARELGAVIRVDAIGNVFARFEGARPELAPVMVGSHLDTQPTGGRFDGVLGVLAGLEAVATLLDSAVAFDHPIEIAVWTNEEGARFVPAMLGSGVYAGVFAPNDALAIVDKSGTSVGAALERIGYAGSGCPMSQRACASFELHIEQGPILESGGTQIGIVTGVQGIRWYDIVIHGDPVHAGPTPMDARRDPFRALPRIVQGLYAAVTKQGEWARVTFGDVRVEPGARNTVPAQLVLAADVRHPDESVLDLLERALRELCDEAAMSAGVSIRVDAIWKSPALAFDSRCIGMVRQATASLGYRCLDVISGAGHDSVYVARVAPTSMIFIPCAGGISHNARESATPEDVEAGANVLLHTLLLAARES